MSSKYPSLVFKLAKAGALLVGSRAAVEAGMLGRDLSQDTDYDMIVPPEKWNTHVAPLIPRGSRTNSLGGIKIQGTRSDGTPVEVDIWPSSLQEYMETAVSRDGPVCVVDIIRRRSYTLGCV